MNSQLPRALVRASGPAHARNCTVIILILAGERWTIDG